MRCWRRLGAAIFALWHLQAGRVVGQFVYPPAATTDNPVDVSGIVVATGTRMTVRWTFPESFLQSNSNFSLRIFHGPVNGIWKYHTLVGK